MMTHLLKVTAFGYGNFKTPEHLNGVRFDENYGFASFNGKSCKLQLYYVEIILILLLFCKQHFGNAACVKDGNLS